MPKKSNLDEISQLEARLARLTAACGPALPEDCGPLAPQAEIASPCEVAAIHPTKTPANSHLLPNTLPETPAPQENGNLIGDSPADSLPLAGPAAMAEANVAQTLTAEPPPLTTSSASPPGPRISCHDPQNSGNQCGAGVSPALSCGAGVSPAIPSVGPDPSAADSDPLAELLHRAVAASKVRRGRPPALDEQAKGQLVALLSVGMSMRQAASVLNVSHTTIQKTLQAEPQLQDDISAARFQAQLQPLACVIREARRSWKAATWLLKYLDSKIATHEETPTERRDRLNRERDEFFSRPIPSTKTRHEHT